MTRKTLHNIYNGLAQALFLLAVAFAFMMLFFIDKLTNGQALWLPMCCIGCVLLGFMAFLADCNDWFYDLLDRINQKKEEKRKEQEEKEKELTYLEDYNYKKLAEEKAYFNDFDGPKDIEKFLVMLKRQHPELNWVEAVYVTYLTGRYHGEIYKN